MPFFSICIPVYNQAGKMNACISSLRDQSCSDFEAIFVDDGSKDSSWEELLSLAEKDPRFRLFRHEENRSLLAARFTGMAHASGRYVLFLDSDDWLGTDALSVLQEALADEKTEILRFGYVDEPDGTEHPAPETENPLESVLGNKIPPSIWKNCYRRDVIGKVLEETEPFYCNMAEDLFLSGVFFSSAEHFERLDACLYHYDRGTGMSSTQTSFSVAKLQRDFASVTACGEHLIRYMEKYHPEHSALTQKRVEDSKLFLLFEHVVYDEDWDRIMETLSSLDTQYFDFACDRLIPYKIKRKMGLITKENAADEFWKIMEV